MPKKQILNRFKLRFNHNINRFTMKRFYIRLAILIALPLTLLSIFIPSESLSVLSGLKVITAQATTASRPFAFWTELASETDLYSSEEAIYYDTPMNSRPNRPEISKKPSYQIEEKNVEQRILLQEYTLNDYWMELFPPLWESLLPQ